MANTSDRQMLAGTSTPKAGKGEDPKRPKEGQKQPGTNAHDSPPYSSKHSTNLRPQQEELKRVFSSEGGSGPACEP